MALDMKAEALSSEPRELLGLFHAIGDPGKLAQKACMILVLGPLMPFLSTSGLLSGGDSLSTKVQIDG